MSEWIQIDPASLNKEKQETIKGVEVRVFVSPHDVPEAIRGAFDNKIKRFVIEFQYIGDEPTKRTKQDKYVDVVTGKNSNRLYAIEIDVSALRAQTVGLNVLVQKEIKDAFKRLIDDPRKTQRRANYRLAQQAISTRQEQLFASLLPRHSGALSPI